jgi:lipoprotein-anchoring transpeptidase ErfK/SrfK
MLIATSAGLCLAATACSGGGGTSSNSSQPAGAKAAQAVAGAQLAISPGNGRSNVRTDGGIRVSAANGKLGTVKVTQHGFPVGGSMNKAGTAWSNTWPLHTSTRYQVTATATGANGKSVTRTSTFRTASPSSTYSVSVFEGLHQTYGVGMPITLTFSQPVHRKAAVERAIQIKTSKPTVGSWYWESDQTLAFRPENYWKQNTDVAFIGHFDGLRIAPGVYGDGNLVQHFRIGASLITVASTRTHHMQVFYKNKLMGIWPISTGMPGDDTANGTYLTIEKGNPTRMKGNGYNVLVPYAVRFTWSGNYIHDAYWSVAQQGVVNVSHGCVNVSPAHSQVYYRLADPGDPVTVIGSPTAGQWGDGWTEWFLTWKQLLKGSATHLAVQAGPDGSTLVDPTTVPAPSHSRLHGAKAHNSTAR